MADFGRRWLRARTQVATWPHAAIIVARTAPRREPDSIHLQRAHDAVLRVVHRHVAHLLALTIGESIEGRFGFFNAYADHASPELAVADLGTVWETMETALKPYPACRLVHASTDAALMLREAHDIDPDDIHSVVIGMSKKGIALTGQVAGRIAAFHSWPEARLIRTEDDQGD